jgi:tetratricopeptide (TPR) repeat protein
MHDMLGFKYTELKNYSAARESYDEAIRLNPNRDQFYNHRGNMYYQVKNYPLALVDFDKTLALNDTQAITYVNRSMTNFYLGKHSTALDDLKRAQEKGATNIPPDYVQALYESFQTDTIRLFTAKIQEDSTNASWYNTRGIAELRLGLFKEALDDFNRALLLRPNSAAIKSNQQVALSNLQHSKKR